MRAWVYEQQIVFNEHVLKVNISTTRKDIEKRIDGFFKSSRRLFFSWLWQFKASYVLQSSLCIARIRARLLSFENLFNKVSNNKGGQNSITEHVMSNCEYKRVSVSFWPLLVNIRTSRDPIYDATWLSKMADTERFKQRYQKALKGFYHSL